MDQSPGDDVLYTVYSGGLEELAQVSTEFCTGEYGDECEFYEVEIQRTHPDDHVWTVHEFPVFDSRAARAVEHHLKARRDVVKMEFGSDERPNMEIRICKARNSNILARHLTQEEREGLDDEDLVVLVMSQEDLEDEAERFLREVETAGSS